MDEEIMFRDFDADMNEIRSLMDKLRFEFAQYTNSKIIGSADRDAVVVNIHETRRQIIAKASAIRNNIDNGAYPCLMEKFSGPAMDQCIRDEIDRQIDFTFEVNNLIVMDRWLSGEYPKNT